jgi:hypothetical protein
LIKVKSADINDVGQNHQILAYGSQLMLRIYDPDYPDNDAVQLALDPTHAATLTYTPAVTVYCFFHTPYAAPAVAPPLNPTRKAADARLRFCLAVRSRLAKLRAQQSQSGELMSAEVHSGFAEPVLGIDAAQSRNSLNFARHD